MSNKQAKSGNSPENRQPIFAIFAFFTAIIQCLILGIASYTSLKASTVHENPQWGEGVGSMLFFGFIGLAELALTITGITLLIISKAKAEPQSTYRNLTKWIYGGFAVLLFLMILIKT